MLSWWPIWEPLHFVVTIAEYACDDVQRRILTLFEMGFFEPSVMGGHEGPPS